MASRESVKLMLKAVGAASCRCPAHSHAHSSAATNPQTKEYAFEMACSNIRYGQGVTQEVGMDFANMGSKKVCILTDKNLAKLPPMQTVLDSMTKAKVNFEVYDSCRVEPTDSSFKDSIDYAKKRDFDAYLAVGGGSVMDTAKCANLYASKPDSDFLDYVNAPIGKGLPVVHNVKPLIAVPTTSGTGSETTGVAIFDFEEIKAKTGIANRVLRPVLGLVDPLHTLSMPERVTAFSGFDVLWDQRIQLLDMPPKNGTGFMKKCPQCRNMMNCRKSRCPICSHDFVAQKEMATKDERAKHRQIGQKLARGRNPGQAHTHAMNTLAKYEGMGYSAMFFYVTAGSRQPMCGVLALDSASVHIQQSNAGITMKNIFKESVREFRKGQQTISNSNAEEMKDISNDDQQKKGISGETANIEKEDEENTSIDVGEIEGLNMDEEKILQSGQIEDVTMKDNIIKIHGNTM